MSNPSGTPDLGTEPPIDLGAFHRVLSLLAEAVTGELISIEAVDADIASVSALVAPRRSALLRETTDELRRIARLPRRVDTESASPQLPASRIYRAVLLRQLGRVEFGTYDVDPETRPAAANAPTDRAERLVDPSADVALLWQLYGALETVRVGAALRRRYPGVVDDLDRLDATEAATLALLAASAPLRDSILAVLRRVALGRNTDADADADGRAGPLVASVARRAPLLRSNEASASLSATYAWELTAAVLRVELDERERRRPSEQNETDADPDPVEPPEPDLDQPGEPLSSALPPTDDLELLGRIDALEGLDVPGFALTADLFADLGELELAGTANGTAAAGASTPELSVVSDPSDPPASSDACEGDDASALSSVPRRVGQTGRVGHERRGPMRSYLYDEWDCHQSGYLRAWCHLREIRLEPAKDGANFAVEVRRRHPRLVAQVRRRFATITPNAFVRTHRTLDGDELSTDALVDGVIERRRGRTADERIYIRRDRAQREVAAAFLLDMSLSTDHPVPDPNAPEPEPSPPPVPDPYESYWDIGPMPQAPPSRRVIDVAKDALVLMGDALDQLGDLYAVYGFSGGGRANVEFFVAKDFADRGGSASWARVAAMEPVRFTRMGPAVRHAARRLAAEPCRTRVLIMLSDGYPQDEDYGPNRNDREYGIADTAQALAEAERLGITTFCITIDPAGHDYLRRMCPQHRYLVLDDVHQLPVQLDKVYRSLTGRND